LTTAVKLSELPALTGIRGFAALWVMLFHAWGLGGAPHLRIDLGIFYFDLSHLCTMGWAGVDIFFTLSAFLLVLPYAAWQLGARSKPQLGEYFRRRVLRIFPAYYAQLFILVALAFFFAIGTLLTFGEFLAHLVLWLDMGWYFVNPINGAWWTLPIEFTFYLGLPILAYALRPRRWIILLLAAIAFTWSYRAIAFHWVTGISVVTVVQHIPGRIDQFVIGMLAGYAFVSARLKQEIPSQRRLSAQFAIAIVGVFGLGWWLLAELTSYWNGEPIFWVWHTCASCFIALAIYAAACDARPARLLFANRTLGFLGEISFGLYLWHVPILGWLAPLFKTIESPDLRFLALLAVAIPSTVLAASLSYVLIERRFLRMGRPHVLHPALATEVASA